MGRNIVTSFWVTVYLFFVIHFANCLVNDPVVNTKQGKVRGSANTLKDGTTYYSFKGIPYAQVPKRFAAPQPPSPWEGIYNATKYGSLCPQFDLISDKVIKGDENCLFVNVYTKSLDVNAKTAVLVYIHGGSFMSGSGDGDFGGIGPEWLLQHNVMLVTLNYRLEMLGFLTLDIPEVPGNAGLRDQLAALKWVQKNIREFGGNPEEITIFGESSGAASVTYHLQSSMSKGLFNKAIVQSGVNIVDYARGRQGKERAFRAAKYLGNNSTDPNEVLEFLRNQPVEKLAKMTYNTMTEDETRRGLPIHFAPVVEKTFEGVEPFITEEPIDSLVAGRVNKVPLMLGYNSDEAIIMLDDAFKKLNFTNENLKYLVPREISTKITKDEEDKLGKRIKEFYIGKKDFTTDDTKQMSDMLSDKYFVYDTHRYAHFYSTSKVYLYKFSSDTKLNAVKLFSSYPNMTGAAHSDDLFYLFNNKYNMDVYKDDIKLQELVFRVTKLWADFANKCDPTPEDYKGPKWPMYSKKDGDYFDINDKSFTPGKNAEKQRVDFWNKIYCDAGLPCMKLEV